MASSTFNQSKDERYGHVMESHTVFSTKPVSFTPEDQPVTKHTRSSQCATNDPDCVLVTGFGMRNQESLQKILLEDEERRKYLEDKYATSGEVECESRSTSSYKMSDASSKFTGISAQSIPAYQLHKKHLEYLMGLETVAVEEYDHGREWLKTEQEGEMAEEKEDEKLSLAMRKAQKYLRSHKIFEFFQFLIAHLLSELPECPITFLLELLCKCLIYRSGLHLPPLLYDKAHLEQLFFLMDRMGTGFIEVEQYKTGMATLGICTYNKKPSLSADGMVSRDTFVDEASERLTELFQDMIRRRKGKSMTPSMVTPPPTLADLTSLGSNAVGALETGYSQ